jgi:hypothetical protein
MKEDIPLGCHIKFPVMRLPRSQEKYTSGCYFITIEINFVDAGALGKKYT